MARFELGAEMRSLSWDPDRRGFSVEAFGERTSHRFESKAQARWEFDRVVAQWRDSGFRAEPESGEPIDFEALERLFGEGQPDPAMVAVTADRLLASGHALGEWMAIQARAQSLGRRDEGRLALQRREAAFLAEHRAEILGPLGTSVVDADTQRYAYDLFRTVWRWGWCRAARQIPAGRVDVGAGALLSMVWAAPALRFIEEIDLCAPPRPGVGGSVAPLEVRLPRLCVLELEGLRLRAGWVSLLDPILNEGLAPRLSDLAVRSSSDLDHFVRALVESRLAAQLVGLDFRGSDMDDRSLAPLLDDPSRFPALKTLRVPGRVGEGSRAALAQTGWEVQFDGRSAARVLALPLPG